MLGRQGLTQKVKTNILSMMPYSLEKQRLTGFISLLYRAYTLGSVYSKEYAVNFKLKYHPQFAKESRILFLF